MKLILVQKTLPRYNTVSHMLQVKGGGAKAVETRDVVTIQENVDRSVFSLTAKLLPLKGHKEDLMEYKIPLTLCLCPSQTS